MIELNVDDVPVQWLVDTLKKKFEDLGEPMSWIGEAYVQAVREHIDDQNGGSWAPPAKDYGHPLLKDSLDLYNGISYSVSSDDQTVTIDSDVDYAVYQDEGTATIPARPFLFIDRPMEDEAEQILNDYVWSRM